MEDAGGAIRDKKAAPSSSAPIFPEVVAGEQQISDASYFVKRMIQENEELGQLLGEETIIAELAAQDHLQKSQVSEQHRQA